MCSGTMTRLPSSSKFCSWALANVITTVLEFGALTVWNWMPARFSAGSFFISS
jgi:hypothetical protein